MEKFIKITNVNNFVTFVNAKNIVKFYGNDNKTDVVISLGGRIETITTYEYISTFQARLEDANIS